MNTKISYFSRFMLHLAMVTDSIVSNGKKKHEKLDPKVKVFFCDFSDSFRWNSSKQMQSCNYGNRSALRCCSVGVSKRNSSDPNFMLHRRDLFFVRKPFEVQTGENNRYHSRCSGLESITPFESSQSDDFISRCFETRSTPSSTMKDLNQRNES